MLNRLRSSDEFPTIMRSLLYLRDDYFYCQTIDTLLSGHQHLHCMGNYHCMPCSWRIISSKNKRNNHPRGLRKMIFSQRTTVPTVGFSCIKTSGFSSHSLKLLSMETQNNHPCVSVFQLIHWNCAVFLKFFPGHFGFVQTLVWRFVRIVSISK